MNSWEQDRKRLLKQIIKLPLDDDDDELVCKHRFLKKNSYISRRWSSFSSEYALSLGPNVDSDALGVNKNEYDVCQYGTLINTMGWLFK